MGSAWCRGALTLLWLIPFERLQMHESPGLLPEDGRGGRTRHWGPSVAQSLFPQAQHPHTPRGALRLCQGMQEGWAPH